MLEKSIFADATEQCAPHEERAHFRFVARLREIPQEFFTINSQTEVSSSSRHKWINEPNVAQSPNRLISQADRDATERFEKSSEHQRFRRTGFSANDAGAESGEKPPV